MKPLFVLPLALLLGCGSLAESPAPVSERAAESIVLSLPEVVALKKRYEQHADDLSIDFEGLSKVSSEKMSGPVWTIGIYLISTGRENWWPWAFFAVDARTGAVFIREPDWKRPEMDAVVYLSLAEWRRSRKEPNQALEPTITAVTIRAAARLAPAVIVGSSITLGK